MKLQNLLFSPWGLNHYTLKRLSAKGTFNKLKRLAITAKQPQYSVGHRPLTSLSVGWLRTAAACHYLATPESIVPYIASLI